MKKLGLIFIGLLLVVAAFEPVERYGAVLLFVRLAAMMLDPPFVATLLLAGVTIGLSRRELWGIPAALVVGALFTALVWVTVPRERDVYSFIYMMIARAWAIMFVAVLVGAISRLIARRSVV